MSLLTITGITKHYGAELILDDVTFRIEPGDHAALIGVNGAGKSTILRIIAGLEDSERGSVSISRGGRSAYLPQEPEFDESSTLYETMLEIFAEAISAQQRLRELEHEMAGTSATPEHVEEYGRLQSYVEHVGYDFRDRIERVLIGLGLEETSWYTPMNTLSGGQKTRANLARTLLLDADVLLLDEPTNHLDIPAVEWLENYLRELKRAFIIVAHDRYLLDRVTSSTLELSAHRVTPYGAPYSRYLELRAERMERQRLEYDAQQAHIAKTEEFIRRYGAGQRSKEARGRQKLLDRLERLERPVEHAAVSLDLKKAHRSGEMVLDMDQLVAGYPDNPLVRLPEQVIVRRGEKIALIGPNGSGKTTLLRTLLGEIEALEGRLRWGARTTIGYYSQTLDRLGKDRTVLEEIQQVRPMSEEEARSFLGRFLFSEDDVFKTINVLSGGEKSRVALARLLLEEPNVLVLDEPTNHLDISARDALQKVLQDFTGTLVFVSHDRYLIDTLTEYLWVIHGGRMSRYAGTYSAYAGGSARPLDYDHQEPFLGEVEGVDPRVRRLESEGEALASRLAEASRSMPAAQLREMSERYTEILQHLEEAQSQWIDLIRDQLHASSA